MTPFSTHPSMATTVYLAISIIFSFSFLSTALSQEKCEEEKANAAIEQSIAYIENADSKAAVAAAKKAVESAENCFAAQLALSKAYDDRFDDVSGFTALPASRGFRKSIAAALALQPNNVEARALEVGYLFNAPSVAGGSKKKAAIRLEELEKLDQLAAAKIRLDRAHNVGDNDNIIIALQALIALQPDNLENRAELVRRLIIIAERYAQADVEMTAWDQITLTPQATAERHLMRGVARVKGNYEFEQAIEYLSAYIQIRPNIDSESLEPVSRAQAYLGDAQRLSGDFEGAKTTYEACLSIEPKNSRALDGLAALRSL